MNHRKLKMCVRIVHRQTAVFRQHDEEERRAAENRGHGEEELVVLDDHL